MTTSNSSLVNVVVSADGSNYSPSSMRKPITKIVIHHMAGVLSAEQCGYIFANPGRGGSAHYGVGNDGRIGLYVDEWDVAWHAGNWDINQCSVGIEISNSSTGGNWPVGSTALNSAIKLVADIAKRNNLGKLVVGQNLGYHSLYSSTYCPGDYLRSKMQYIADEANKINYPPAPAAETIIWTNLSSTKEMRTTKDLDIIDLDAKKTAGTIAKGTIVSNLVQKTTVGGVEYYRTSWSKTNNKNNGLFTKYLEEIVIPAPSPKPAPEKVPVPEEQIIDGTKEDINPPVVKPSDITPVEPTEEHEEERRGLTDEEYTNVLKSIMDTVELVDDVVKKFNIRIHMSNKVYDVLKIVATVALPAISMLYVGLANIWGFGFGDQVDATIQLLIAVINTVLGLVIVKSSSDYKKNN